LIGDRVNPPSIKFWLRRGEFLEALDQALGTERSELDLGAAIGSHKHGSWVAGDVVRNPELVGIVQHMGNLVVSVIDVGNANYLNAGALS